MKINSNVTNKTVDYFNQYFANIGRNLTSKLT